MTGIKTSTIDDQYGVVIVFGSFITYFITIGMTQSLGVMYSDILDYFKRGKGETAWLTSLFTGMIFLMGPVAGILRERFGSRCMAMLGSLIMASGMLASAFAEYLVILYIMFGIVSGIGASFVLLSGEVIVPMYFKKRPSLAISMATLGIGVSTMAVPPLTRYLLNVYTWRGTFIIMAGISLQGVVGGALFRPPHIDDQKDDVIQSSRLSFLSNIKPIVKDKTFMLFTMGGFLMVLGVYPLYVLLPDFASERNISDENQAYLVTAAGVANILARIIFGPVANMLSNNKIYLFTISLAVLGISSIACTLFWLFEYLIVYSLMLGMCSAIGGFMQPVVAFDILGRKYMSIGLGLLMCVEGLSATTGSALAGWIADLTGSYNSSFYFAGGVLILGAVVVIPIPIMRKRMEVT